ncbi:adenine nucleotide alpha hydrolase family protein [Candidatus Woesearchaeota archaeon]|nr:adenine nucleotide alpha hydrolase family protein [Candidatus Woesearchaeota archaeon]
MPKNNKFIGKLEEKVRKTIKKYNLIDSKDKVLVACSGGKDSTTILYLIKKLGYNVKAITVDLGIGSYSKKNLENLGAFCKENKIKLIKISFKEEFGHTQCYLRDVLKSKGIKLKSCSVCGVLRRYLLNKKARELKATKLITGHNLDDECQAVLMNLFRNTLERSSRLGPISGIVKDKKFVPRVKPLYFCLEKDVEEYSRLMGFPVLYQKCPCSYDVFRNQIKNRLNSYEKRHPQVKEHIITYFLRTLPKLRKIYKQNKEILLCKNCGEPSKKGFCNSCRIISMLKN